MNKYWRCTWKIYTNQDRDQRWIISTKITFNKTSLTIIFCFLKYQKLLNVLKISHNASYHSFEHLLQLLELLRWRVQLQRFRSRFHHTTRTLLLQAPNIAHQGTRDQSCFPQDGASFFHCGNAQPSEPAETNPIPTHKNAKLSHSVNGQP